MKLEQESEHYSFGKELFGPFLYYYSGWLLQEIMKTKIDKVFFLARDGFMMQKGFRKAAEKNNIHIENEYVYFSRKSIRTALLWKIDNYIESIKYMSVSRYISVGEILDYYGFKSSEYELISKKYNLNISDEILFSELSSDKKIKDMYLAEQKHINENSKKQYDLIVEYLRQISFVGKVAIVDIGWHGSMQFYIEELTKRCGLDVDILGLYVGVNPICNISGLTKGYIFSGDCLKYRKSILCFFGIWERLFQSKEGSTLGYKKVNGVVMPIQGKYEYKDDTYICSAIDSIQQGALDCFDDVSKMCAAEKAAKNIIRFGKYPTKKELHLFLGFYNTDGKKTYYLPQKSIFRYKIREFIRDLSDSPWKTGFMKQAFKIPFPYYWIYALMRR